MSSRIAKFSALPLASLLLPALASAETLSGTLFLLSNLFNAAIGILITMAIVVFFWGLVKYLWSQDTENAHEGLKIMFWGLVAIFVMVSIWGIIKLLQNTFKVTDTKAVFPMGIPYGATGQQ